MKQKAQLFILALALPVLVAGCSWKQFWTGVGLVGAAGAGAAAVYYAKGDLETDVDEDIETVYDAAEASLKENGYQVKEGELEDDSARLEAETEGGEDMTVRLSKDEGQTHVSIRAGVLGDEERSRSIWYDMAQRLNVETSEDTKKAARESKEEDVKMGEPPETEATM